MDSWIARTFESLLNQDISTIVNGGTLPYQLTLMATGVVYGKYLVQLEDIIDIAAEEPRKGKSNGTLKCTFFDGQQQVYGLELTDMKHCLSVRTPPGSKFLLHDPIVHRGIILLTRNNCRYLGGVVVEVQEKRDSLIKDIMQQAKYRVEGFQQTSGDKEVDSNHVDNNMIAIGQGISNWHNNNEEEEEEENI
ncbi:hypothetical protein Gasu_22660 isoform 1 [Galdieria sulphuraria]|nr:hypothetical protein Gasu_22660 isoform 1 [Galdieria sulphuraria]EME30358.1 hypothetical protein Gasu_22660 isoform 1 [Galdieria sulphuraria]|eukprot:XP_005706878.1 hypothetical protein isoform 1 [Galdieria sulphuraria]